MLTVPSLQKQTSFLYKLPSIKRLDEPVISRTSTIVVVISIDFWVVSMTWRKYNLFLLFPIRDDLIIRKVASIIFF